MRIDFDKLPRVVAIVGSRDFPHGKWVLTFVNRLNAGTIVTSGGARGVDTVAELTTNARDDLYFKPHDVEDFEWKLLGKSVGHFRNEQLVRWVKRFDGIVVVFHCINPKTKVMTPGSTNVVTNCLKQSVPFILISETGEIAGNYISSQTSDG